MIEIQGDFKKGKEMMKNIRKQKVSRINELERKHRKLKGLPPTAEQKELRTLQHELKFYSVNITLPAEIHGKVINGKLLQAFVKKLKGFQYEIIDQEGAILLQYGKTPGTWTGRLVLYDITKYYQGFPDIPTIQIEG